MLNFKCTQDLNVSVLTIYFIKNVICLFEMLFILCMVFLIEGYYMFVNRLVLFWIFRFFSA